jgi:hypothetical protein
MLLLRKCSFAAVKSIRSLLCDAKVTTCHLRASQHTGPQHDENINAKCRVRGIGVLRDPRLNKVWLLL